MYSTVVYSTVLYYTVQDNIFTKNCQNHFKVTTNQLEEGGGLEPIVSSLQKVKMYVKRYRVDKDAKSAKVTRCQGDKGNKGA